MTEQPPKYAPESPDNDFDYWLVRLNFETCAHFIRGGNVLELGCFAGFSTSLLHGIVQKLTVVDLSEENLELTRGRLGDAAATVRLVHAAWEDFTPSEQYSDIVMWRGLEHVVDPVSLLRQMRGWLEPEGRVHIVVPNALSLHRRVGVAMGLLNEVHELNERDHEVGHQRVYDRALLIRHLNEAGIQPIHWQGMYLKPLSNSQMLNWPEPLIRAFYEVGRELPDYCAEVYVCGRNVQGT